MISGDATAIYGGWGTGKTSAIRWPEGWLIQWNVSAKPRLRNKEDVRIVRTAWFYPWKYQAREEVWRGPVAEVILAWSAAIGEDPSSSPVLYLTDSEIEALDRRRGDVELQAESAEEKLGDSLESAPAAVLDRIPKHFLELAE